MEKSVQRIIFIAKRSDLFNDVIALLKEQSPLEYRVVASNEEALSLLENFEPTLIVSKLQGTQPTWKDPLGEARTASMPIPVVFIRAAESFTEAGEESKEGKEDFPKTPLDAREVVGRIQDALEGGSVRRELKELQQELRFRRNADYIVGGSTAVQDLLAQIQKVTASDLSVLITGDSGTGKELVARAIHYNSRRAGGPFITVNCAVLAPMLFENELFGHVRGGYTGAETDKRGLYEEANGGTLFLDEVGEVDFFCQSKLLRVMDRGEFRQVGGVGLIKSDVRLIAATNRDLESAVDAGKFREDLYYRLNVFRIRVPPLRERREDIPQLAQHFLQRHSGEVGKKLQGFSPSAIQKLMFYSWPGNLRELENKVRQAAINASGPVIYREDIDLDEEKGPAHLKSFREAKQQFEKEYIANVLRLTMGNVAKAARLAGKERKDFYDLMKKYKIRQQDFRRQ